MDLNNDKLSAMQQPEHLLLNINGKTFVSNLYWQIFSSKKNLEKDIKNTNSENKYSLKAVGYNKKKASYQVGFCQEIGKNSTSYYSLALSLAEILGDNWIGVFQFDEYWIFVAVIDGFVSPVNGDVFSNENEITCIAKDAAKLYSDKIERFIAPDGINLSHADEHLTLIDVLNVKHLKSGNKLKLIKPSPVPIALISLPVVLVIAYFSFTTLFDNEEAPTQDIISTVFFPQEVKPWVNSPSPSSFSNACLEMLNTVPLSINGWIFNSAECSSERVELKFSRTELTTVEYFSHAVKTLFNVEPIFHNNGNGAEVLLKVPDLNKDSFSGTLNNDNALTKTLSHFQRLNINADVKTNTAQTFNENGDEVLTPWKTFVFSFNTKITPSFIFSEMGAKSGVRLTKITASLDNSNIDLLSFNVEGNIYAQ